MDAAALTKEQLVDLVSQQHQKIAALEQQLRLLLSKQYGRKSEQSVPDTQGALFESSDAQASSEEDDQVVEITYQRKVRGKRRPCDAALERQRVEYTLSESEQRCACGGQLNAIGTVSSEQYEFIPARYLVIEHVQHKYACPCCQSQVKLAPKPAQILPKSNAGPGLLAQVAVSKFVDGVPLHRQEAQHARGGLQLPSNTMARWLIRLSEPIMPLLNLFEDAIRAGPVQQCDETPLQVLNEPGRKAQSLSYIWTRRGGVPGREVVLYHYSPSRSSQVALQLFEGYEGYVQCDGYAGYHILASHNITLVGCLAHARRKFNDALKALAKKEAVQKAKAGVAMKYIKDLYAIETQGKVLSEEQRYRLRQEKALPLLKEFKTWLESQTVLPKSPLGKAINYTLNQWPKLIRYCDQGFLNIDNNPTERTIRPVAIGRRNWLFASSVDGAHTNTRFYSLIETCKLHGHESYAYLKHIFKELPRAATVEDFEALLPWNLDAERLKKNVKEV